MKLTGDAKGMEELKYFHGNEGKKEYLRLILNEAKTNTNFKTEFKDRTNTERYSLVYNPVTSEFLVEKL